MCQAKYETYGIWSKIQKRLTKPIIWHLCSQPYLYFITLSCNYYLSLLHVLRLKMPRTSFFSSSCCIALLNTETLNRLTFVDEHAQASTSAFSAPQRFDPAGVRPEFDFEALGIYNAPCWSVQLPDGSGGTQVVQVPRAPLVEGLPLPPTVQVASLWFFLPTSLLIWLVLKWNLYFAGATQGCLWVLVRARRCPETYNCNKGELWLSWCYCFTYISFGKLSWCFQFRRLRAGLVCQLCEVELRNERVGVIAVDEALWDKKHVTQGFG